MNRLFEIRNLGAVIIDEIRIDFIQRALDATGHMHRLLDLGCGEKPFEPLYRNKVKQVKGIDVPYTRHDQSRVDAFALGTALPFKDATFDIVLCTEVMEHVSEPERLLEEGYRVLKPDGLLLLTTPFLVPLHEEPYDFFRYTSYGLRHLCEKTGFTIMMLEPFSESFGVIISFMVQVQLKVWNLLSRKLKLPVLRSVLNPCIFLFTYLPQIVYIKLYQRRSKNDILAKLIKQFSYTPKGYGVLARR